MTHATGAARTLATMLVALSCATGVCARAFAQAPDARCVGLPISVDGAIDTLWLEAIGRACEQLGEGTKIDHEATLRMHAFGDALVIEATLMDGRRAVRHVTTPLALGRVLEALLVLPSATTSRADAAGGADSVAVPVDDANGAPDADDAPGAAPAPPPDDHARARALNPPDAVQHLAFHAGVGLMGRATREANLSLGVEAHGTISLGAGELGVIARWVPAMQTPSSAPAGFESAEFGVGVVVGARLRLGAVVELGAGVQVTVLDRLESVTIGADEISGSNTDLRVGALVRLELFAGHGLAPFVSVDAEISPLVAGRTVRIDPALPTQAAWSAGTSIGVAWTGT